MRDLVNGKNKGNAFERRIAKRLSEWSGYKFMRTPASGAIHNFRDKRVVSDIVPSLAAGEFPFSIECKNVETSWDFSTFLKGTSQTLNSHWKQCVEDAHREDLKPMLIFTKNYHNDYVMIRYEDYEKLPPMNHVRIRVREDDLVIFELTDLLSVVTISDLQKL